MVGGPGGPGTTRAASGAQGRRWRHGPSAPAHHGERAQACGREPSPQLPVTVLVCGSALGEEEPIAFAAPSG